MQVIENLKVKEKLYTEKLENGLTVMIIPKKGIQKKYIIWGTNYGSNDSTFIVPGETEITEVPKGVAHFLEHKMFEQENGKNSLDVLTALGVNANAYTTNNHTAYLYECTDNFYEALDEFMDYVQHPYFTDENVEKEKGIIGQEIMMYDDYPDWKVYLNALECMYHKNPVKLDITGTVETISHIDKEILYKCYNTFYNPSNMAMVISGDFEPEKLLELYSIVFQDVTLFNNTVMENIRIGKKDATDEEVIAAAKLAHCDEFVEKMPDQWNTMIGENGSELSGGQRQRISIARAFLKDAPIILMDEATASLDVDNESLIQESISKLIENKTVLVIAHRMRTVDGVDKIVVLKEGVVAEQGKPQELKQQKGIYKHMVDMQMQSNAWKYQ